MMIERKEIDISAQEVFRRYITNVDNSTYNFTNMFMWCDKTGITYAEVDGCLVLFFQFGKQPVSVSYPVGEGDKKAAILYLLLLPGILVVAVGMLYRLLKDLGDTGTLITGITAAAGIGTNLYLCKIAMDIVAKHVEADEDGVRIAQLDELSYRRLLWDHRPLTDFWRVGRGYQKKLEKNGIFTMGDIARCSLGNPNDFYNEDLLYKLFGVNAELLIDHAWGIEPCTIADIKAYKPESNSLSSGQVLTCAYTAQKAKLVMREMTDLLVLDLVDKGLVTDQMVLTVGYDIDNLLDPERRKRYQGQVITDPYGRKIPKHAHGTATLSGHTSSTREIVDAVIDLYDRIVDEDLLVRRMTIAACHLLPETDVMPSGIGMQMDLFSLENPAEKEENRQREKRRQQAVIEIKKKFGKNAILKGMNLEEGATARDRNRQIGGHKA